MPSCRYRYLCRIFVALLSIASSAAAQVPANETTPPRIRSEAREVLVPVVVTNGKGRHISGLKAADFEIFEDGKPERIVSFSTESGTGPAASLENLNSRPATPGAGAGASGAPRQTYLILIDTLHSSFANFGRIRDGLGKFFEKEQSAEAQYAVIALGREPRIVQDSTRDAAAVLGAIRAKGFLQMVLDSEAANLGAAADQFATLMRDYCSACRCSSAGNQTDEPYCPDRKSRVQAFLTSFGERTLLLNEQFLRELAKIVEAIASMPTSRTVIFISDGFNRFPGRELTAILTGYGPKDRNFPTNPRDTQPELDAVLKFATAHDVKFYTIDSRGLYTIGGVTGSGFDASSSSAINTQMDSRTGPNIAAGVPEAAQSRASSVARENADVLAQLARETGGIFYENSNDVAKGLRQAVADGREYYLLAYVPGDGLMDGKFRKITVTVKGGKWQAQAKAGYWAVPTQ